MYIKHQNCIAHFFSLIDYNFITPLYVNSYTDTTKLCITLLKISFIEEGESSTLEKAYMYSYCSQVKRLLMYFF
jgi:hypothetical protein